MSRPEPTFTLKATDPHAAAALDRYADLMESHRAPVGRISAARHVAQKMRNWLAEQKPEVKAEEPAPAVTDIEPEEAAEPSIDVAPVDGKTIATGEFDSSLPVKSGRKKS